MKAVVILTILFALGCALLQPASFWAERGIDISDGKYQIFQNYKLQISTKCNEINLNIPGKPYNYNGTVMSGYLNVGKGGSALAFIFYGKQNVERAKLPNIPTIIWLNGGPGSSSQLGNFMELGPFWVVESRTRPYDVIRNNFTWTKDYNILFVDQPVGTGLSYADQEFPNSYCTSMTDVANDFYAALKELYNNQNGCFNKLNIKGDHSLFIFGESYAGKYAPAIAEKILRQAATNKGFLTGLKGVAIGDGFTNPYDTLSMMGEYAYNFGLIDYQQRAKIEQIILNATYQNLNKHWRPLHVSFYKVLNLITSSTGGVNVYDITKYKPYPTQLLDEYFGSSQIREIYKLEPGTKFNAQSSNVGEALYEDFMKNQVQLVQKLLMNYNVKVLIYTGQNDLIVQTPGTFRWVERLFYQDGEKFRDTLFNTWKVKGKVAGYAKSAGNLELRTFNNAGHLVPMDQGEAALQALNQFVKKSLSQNSQTM